MNEKLKKKLKELIDRRNKFVKQLRESGSDSSDDTLKELWLLRTLAYNELMWEEQINVNKNE